MAGLGGEESVKQPPSHKLLYLYHAAGLMTLALDLESSEISGRYAEEAGCPLFFFIP